MDKVHEERIAKVEESLIQQQAASLTLLGIVKDIDRKVDEINGNMRSIQAHEMLVDARISAVNAQVASTDAQVRLLQQGMAASFKQMVEDVDDRFDTLEVKLNRVIELLGNQEK